MRFIWTLFVALACFQTQSEAQQLHAVWVLNEGYPAGGEPVTLGRMDAATGLYELVATFPQANFASHLLIDPTSGVYVAADAKIFRLDPDNYDILAEVDVPGVRKLALFNGQLYATRGDVVSFDSYLWSFDPLTLEVEAVFPAEAGQGPEVPAEGLVVVGDALYLAVNNGFAWGAEVGRIGQLDADGNYSEFELPAGGENIVQLMAHDGALCAVSNGAWDSTTLTRLEPATGDISSVTIADVSAGCNAAALVEDRLAFQVYGETAVRQADAWTLAEQPGLDLGGDSYYSMAVDPLSGNIYGAHTDWFSYGQVDVFDAAGNFLSSFDCGTSPGNMAVEIRGTVNVAELAETAFDAQGKVRNFDAMGREIVKPVLAQGAAGFVIQVNEKGQVRKVIQP
jgi:hypothetical protein